MRRRIQAHLLAVGDLDQAMEFDLTLRDSTDEEVQSMVPIDLHDPPCGSLSDIESVRSVPQQRRSRPRRRLRLTWQMEQGADTRHRDVRAASQLVEALARRVGAFLMVHHSHVQFSSSVGLHSMFR